MCEKKYPGYQSLFFKNLATSQNKRMEQKTYRLIVDKVSSLYLKISPRGCSQNTRISYSDIDKTQQEIKSQIRSSSEFAEQELSKLNNPLKPISVSSPRCKRPTFVSPFHLITKKKVHQKRACQEESLMSDDLDLLINKCETFKPELLPKRREIVSHGFFRMSTSGNAYNYIQDLSECLRNTGDEEKIKDMMSTMKYNRNTDKGLRNELKYIKEELLETTNRIVKMTPYKLWRQNNIAFMSNTDKVIYSLPSVKN